jgi:hypothetical protein
VVLIALIGALTLAGTAAGYTAGRVLTARPGDRADFPTKPAGQWSCTNRGAFVDCQSGDAYPYVRLTGSRSGGVTVNVYTLNDPQGGHLTRTYQHGHPVYIFSAL